VIAAKRKKIAVAASVPSCVGLHPMTEVASPCTGVCRIDRATGGCAGCGRTLSEIAAWPSATPQAKRAILARLSARSAGDRP